MGLRTKAAKGVFWSGAQLWGGRALSFIVFITLSRLLGPEAFGLVAMAAVFLSFVQIFLDQGFGDAIVQRAELEREHLDTAFWTNVLMGGLLTLASVGASGLIASLFHEPRLIGVVRWLSLGFILSGLSSAQRAILRRELAFKELAVRSLVATLVGGAVGVTLAFLGFGVWSLVAQQLVGSLIGVVVLWNVSQWRPGFHFSIRHFRELFGFGLNIVGIAFLNFLNRRSDDFLIGYFLGPTMLGFYSVAYRLLLTMTDLLTGITTAVAFPTFSRLQGDIREMRHAFYQATYYTSLVSFPAFVAVSVLSQEVVWAFFGDSWTLSIPVMRILAGIGILHSVFYFHHSVVIASGKPSWRLALGALNAFANVLVFVLVVRWGIVAVAAGYVLRGYLLSPVEIWMVHTLLEVDVKTYLSQFRGPLVGSVAMALVVTVLRHALAGVLSVYLQLVIYVLVGGVVYLLAVQVMVPSFWKQVSELIRLLLPQSIVGLEDGRSGKT